jgi:hypothetical protein
MPLRATYHSILSTLGFKDGRDLLSGALGWQAYSAGVFKWLAAGTLVTSVVSFCTHWIWDPPGALFLLLFLDMTNAWYGYQVAKKLKGERFKWSEFTRLGGVMISTLIIMGSVRNAINSYSWLELMADVVFAWLFSVRGKKVLAKMVALKVQEEGAASIFQSALKALLASKLGALVVDEVQRHPPRTSVPIVSDPNPPLSGDTEQPS